jgi:hypothetical protein
MVESRTTIWSPDAKWILFFATWVLIALVTAIAPMEKDLGVNARLVYFHGAWAWGGLIFFIASACSGLFGLLFRRVSLHHWSKSLSWTGMVFWFTYLPLSLVVMRINWGGFFFDEPRWRIPLAFAIVGLLLQGGLFLLNQPALTSLANIGFAGALLYSLSHITNLLHPDSPILASSSRGIQFFFFGLLILSVIAGIQITAAISARLQHK